MQSQELSLTAPAVGGSEEALGGVPKSWSLNESRFVLQTKLGLCYGRTCPWAPCDKAGRAGLCSCLLHTAQAREGSERDYLSLWGNTAATGGICCLSQFLFQSFCCYSHLIPSRTAGKDGNGKKIGQFLVHSLCNRCSVHLWVQTELNLLPCPEHACRQHLPQEPGISAFHISWRDAKQNLIACGEIFLCG